MYDTILVPTDGSEHAHRAAEHARTLASAFDASVHVLAVVDVDAAAGPFSAGGVDEAYLDRLGAGADEALEDVEAAIGGDIPVYTDRRKGHSSEEILSYVDEFGIDAIAMGTHGRTGVSRFVAGSVTETVLRQSPVPVLTVRATERSVVEGGYEEIMIPTDGSEAAGAAVEHGIAVAAAFDARVHAVNIVDVGALSGGPGYTFPEELLDAMREAGEHATAPIVEQAHAAGLEAVSEVSENFPSKGLLEYAEDNDIDLIAMGTAGQTGLSRYLLGSTTERIVRHAEMPVFAVNARRRD